MLWNNYSSFFFYYLCFNSRLSYTKKEMKSSLRVIGGRLAAKNEFPYIIRLEYLNKEADYKSLCTGSVLTPSWSLTAAHCVGNFKKDKFFVRFNHFLPEIKGNVAKILMAYKHPRTILQLRFARYDIAILQTETVEISRYAKLGALDWTTLIGQEVISVGHGITNITKGPEPLQVLKGMLSKCNYNRKSADDIFMGLCMQVSCGIQATTTPGDSGGPVIHSSGIVAVISKVAYMYLEEEKRLRPYYLKPPASTVACVSPVLDWITNLLTNQTR